jgi:thiamine-phosphate pyrophosphorylase
VVSVSCHTLDEVQRAHRAEVDLILFGPVFEKRVEGEVVAPGAGLAGLQAACKVAPGSPVLALGGITVANTPACLAAGAAGIAGIRLFA